MALASALSGAAVKVIGQFGTPMTVRLIEPPGEYDPETGQAGGRPTDVPTRGVLEAYRAHEIDGPIQHGDSKITVPANLPRAPKPSDEVVVAGTVYRVIAVEPVYAEDQAVIYTMQARR